MQLPIEMLLLVVAVTLLPSGYTFGYGNTYGYGGGGGYGYGYGASYPIGYKTLIGGGHRSRDLNNDNLLTCVSGQQGGGIVVNFQNTNQQGQWHGLQSRKSGGKQGGVNATIELVALFMGDVNIIVAETGQCAVGNPCVTAEFGLGLTPQRNTRKQFGHGVHGAYGPYGPVGVYGGYGGHGGPGSSKGALSNPLGNGVLASVSLVTGIQHSILLQDLDYNSLGELAGRSIMVCTQSMVVSMGRAQCTGGVLACCTIIYAGTRRVLADANCIPC